MIKIVPGKKRIRRLLSMPGAAARHWRSKDSLRDGGAMGGSGKPSVYHATVVIFLEFFAWGLLTAPTITVLNETFGDHTFLMNGLVQGIKGTLSFLSAPLIGALSDVWGRKSFLLITVFFTCLPIPMLRFNPWWFFSCVSISGVFAVTFSVVFAYVSDCTDENDRSQAYGLVSATFAASLITSPGLGAYLSRVYDDTLVIVLASAIALLDLIFILVMVPESLPERVRPASWGAPITWEQADPFSSLRKVVVSQDSTVLLLCVIIFLSYLPEAGQYSCIFLYLKQVIGFSGENLASYIAVVGLLSVVAQTLALTMLIRTLGLKNTILLALTFQIVQLLWFGFGTQFWMMWAAGALAAMSSLAYPSISALVSCHADSDQQGVVQGMITGIRGLCNGIGPAMFGVIFDLFHVNLGGGEFGDLHSEKNATVSLSASGQSITDFIPGPPFVFGSGLVFLALLVALFIPDQSNNTKHPPSPTKREARLSLSNSEYDSTTEGNHHDLVHLLKDEELRT